MGWRTSDLGIHCHSLYPDRLACFHRRLYHASSWTCPRESNGKALWSEPKSCQVHWCSCRKDKWSPPRHSVCQDVHLGGELRAVDFGVANGWIECSQIGFVSTWIRKSLYGSPTGYCCRMLIYRLRSCKHGRWPFGVYPLFSLGCFQPDSFPPFVLSNGFCPAGPSQSQCGQSGGLSKHEGNWKSRGNWEWKVPSRRW